MFGVRRLTTSAAIFTASLTLTSVSAFGQDVLSARSGLVHYIEGDVSIDGKPVGDRNGTFSEVKKDGQLATTLGRAEVLLTPGVFLRVGENSSIRMKETALDDTKVEFVGGKTMLESDTPMKDNHVMVFYKDYAVTPVDHGLYEFTSEPAQLAVYAGEADVTAGGQTVRVKAGKKLIFTAALAQERFNDKDGDSLYRWSKMRSEYLSVANVSAARQAGQSGSYFDGTGSNGIGMGNGSWFFNPFYDMYTFLPFSGMAFSPFGFGFYSPFAFNQFYSPFGYYGGGYYPTYGGGTSSGGGSANKNGNGTGGWRSINHPIRPVSGTTVASLTRPSSGGSAFHGGVPSSSSPWGASIPSTTLSSSAPTGMPSGSMGHSGGGSVGGGTHK
jgi:hypothetical protein